MPDAVSVAGMTVRAIEQRCAPCVSSTMYVREHLLDADTMLGEEQPMSIDTRGAIERAYPDAAFVSRPAEEALFGEDGVISRGGVVVYVGVAEELADGVVGIPVGTLTARDGGRFDFVQFRWDGEAWNVATSEETGITVTTVVS